MAANKQAKAAARKRPAILPAVAVGRGTSRDVARDTVSAALLFHNRPLAGRLTNEAQDGPKGTVWEYVANARQCDKALKAQLAAAPNSQETKALLAANQAAIKAVAQAEPQTMREAAQQLAFIVSKTAANMKCRPNEAPDHAGFDLAKFGATLLRLTDYAPSKRWLPALTKGKRVTRAGLLYRYHAFLGMELNLVGLELYGCREVARQFMPIDGKVDAVLFKDGNAKQETRLPRRARAALSALGIDTVKAD